MERPLTVVVAGGGVAGIATALRLADRGHAVRLLERRPFLGGRAYSFPDPVLGRSLDNGQHALLGCYHETLALLRRIGAADRLHWLGLRIEMREGSRRGRIDAGRAPAPLHLARALAGYALLSRKEMLSAMLGALRLVARWKRSPERLANATVREALAEIGQSELVCRRLWDPIAIAALNAHPARACAALFAAVVEKAFFGRASDAAIVLPGAPLSDVFGAPGERTLARAGVDVLLRTTLSGVRLDGEGRVAAAASRDGRVWDADAVVLALPPSALGGLTVGGASARTVLGSWMDRVQESVPIVSAHVPVARRLDLPAMIGLLGTTTQWVFHTRRFRREDEGDGALLSCVVSDAASLDEWDDRAVAARVTRDLTTAIPEIGSVDESRIRVVREKHATVAATVEATAARPPAETAVRGLALAGDWIRTGLPATLESAAQSARLAAGVVERLRPRHEARAEGRAA